MTVEIRGEGGSGTSNVWCEENDCDFRRIELPDSDSLELTQEQDNLTKLQHHIIIHRRTSDDVWSRLNQ